jgi:endo-1,4-beta-xylanase
MMKQKKAILSLVLVVIISIILTGQDKLYTGETDRTTAAAGPPIADGLPKFFGCAYSGAQSTEFENYWNQVTPENGGKWGSCENQRDVMSWGEFDAAYNFAKTNSFWVKDHCLVWGNQQPSWIENLDTTEQREEIEEWFSLVAARYPDLNMVEVVNEPLNDPPDAPGQGGGNYIEALGGTGVTGWDWVIEAFRIARKYFPETNLMINEYGVISSVGNAQDYVEIIELLQEEDTLIDAIGVQAHAFSTTASSEVISRCLDTLAATGLPIYVTEMDIDGNTDLNQIKEYRRVFPIFWEHPAVKGITLWGYRPGMWRTSTAAYLINYDGTERPAMIWLRGYVQGTFVDMDSIIITPEGGIPEINTDKGTLQLSAEILPGNATIQDVTWISGSKDLASVSENGLVTALINGTVNIRAIAGDGSGVTGYLDITITGQATGTEDERAGEAGRFVIYPNPSVDGNFTITGTENITRVCVTDLSGKQVKKLYVSGRPSIDIRIDTGSDLYIVELFNGQRFFYKKIMVL